MPPRYAYWTILAGGLPTSFRAADREDLLPTLRRLQERHPDAEMKWFARGKLWASPEAVRSDPPPLSSSRGREWRPGGEHRDPREKFKAAKRDRNQALRKQRFARKHETGSAPAKPNSAPEPRPLPRPRPDGRGPDTRPRGPDTRPRGPDTRPRGPDTRPRGPDTRPRGPDTRPRGPDTRPRGSDTRPREPGTRPQGQGKGRGPAKGGRRR